MRQRTPPLPRARPARVAPVRRGASPTLRCCLALALSLGGVYAQAGAPALLQVQHIDPAQLHPATPRSTDAGQHGTASPDAPQPIDPEQLKPPALQSPGPDNPSQERALQKLRASATAASPSRAPGAPPPRDAAWLLGLLALHGQAMPANAADAHHWFERAQRLGNPLAPAGLAWCLMDGCTGPPNPVAARAWIARLRSADPGRALYLEWLVETQLAPLRIATPGRPDTLAASKRGPRRDLLVRAAQAGNAQALNELGLENVSAARLPQALAQFRAAAQRSPAAAANARLLASRLQTPAQSPPHKGSADEWFAQALRYHRGDGVPANYTEALRLYQLAAANGSQPAQRMLERIYSRPGPHGALDIAWMQQLANLNVTREGALLSTLPAPSPQIFVRDPTPLYDMIPPLWRTAPNGLRH